MNFIGLHQVFCGVSRIYQKIHGFHCLDQKTYFEFINGLLDYPIAHTPSRTPILKKWLHPENISNEIASTTFTKWRF